jgi:hypothetical protein
MIVTVALLCVVVGEGLLMTFVLGLCIAVGGGVILMCPVIRRLLCSLYCSLWFDPLLNLVVVL